MPTQASVVYITAENKQQATTIGDHLVKERLVACVNIIDGMTSIYWWNSHVEQEQETVILAKTRSENVPAVISRVKALHSYDCPCITAWPIAQSSAEYLSWIERETQPPAT